MNSCGELEPATTQRRHLTSTIVETLVHIVKWNTLSYYSPSFEEGRLAPIKQMFRYLKIGAAGEVSHILNSD